MDFDLYSDGASEQRQRQKKLTFSLTVSRSVLIVNESLKIRNGLVLKKIKLPDVKTCLLLVGAVQHCISHSKLLRSLSPRI